MNISHLQDITTICQKALISYKQHHPDTKEAIQDTYKILIDCILGHNDLYYNKAQAIISDGERDNLFRFLQDIENTFPDIIQDTSPTQSLHDQYTPSSGFKSVKHTVAMVSLENSYNAEDIYAFHERVTKELSKHIDQLGDISYNVEPKYDGIAVELVYQQGVLIRAVTRGDGITGDDITENVKTIKNLPQYIHNRSKRLSYGIDTIVYRGEIVMAKSSLRTINQERNKTGDSPFATTRNAAAGSIKLLDKRIVSKRQLQCFIYDILSHTHIGGIDMTIYNNLSTHLEELGLPYLPHRPYASHTIEDIIKICSNPETKKHIDTLDIDFDGLVIKVQNNIYRTYLGTTQHHPRWAIAYKFPSEQQSSQILNVRMQLGRTGIITPVADIQPILLGGVNVATVTLHNFDTIQSKDIHIGDYVYVQRSGEVIPHVIGVDISKRTANIGQVPIAVPTHCPSCSYPVENKENFYYCVNSSCQGQLLEQCKHLVSRDALDIAGLGGSILSILIDQGYIKKLLDIFRLIEPEKIANIKRMPGFGAKKAQQIYDGVMAAKSKELRRFLHGLSIPNVGKKIAQSIASVIEKDQETIPYTTLIATLKDQQKLLEIYGMGKIIVDGIQEYLEKNPHIFKELDSLGIIWKNTQSSHNDQHITTYFCITGTFAYSRDTIIQALEQTGARYTPSITQQTTVLIAGEKGGSKKTQATSLGIEILSTRDTIIQRFPNLIHLGEIKSVGPKTKPNIQTQQGNLFS